MLNPSFPPSTGNGGGDNGGGGSDPELASRVEELETDFFSLGNRIQDLENMRYEAWVYEDLRVDSTVTFETSVELPPFVGDLTDLTIEVMGPTGSYTHTFASTPSSLDELVAEVSATIEPSGVSFALTGGDPQLGLMFGVSSGGDSVSINLYGTALPNLGFTEGYYANESVLTHFASGTDGIFDINAYRKLDVTLAAMTAEIEALKAQVASLGGT